MKEQSIIHVKIDYDDAVQSKRDLLSSERDFLRVLKIVKRYHLLRKEELTNKLKLQNKMKDLKTNLAKLNEILPKVKIPNILKKDKEDLQEGNHKKSKENDRDNDLESQLREIQERLRKLG
jgi:hypothetical protein